MLITKSGVQACDFDTFQSDMMDQDSLLLIGTGKSMQPLPASYRAYLETHTIPYDYMQTASACRTYNVLLAENRAVSALSWASGL